METKYTHIWNGKNFLPERKGDLCRILVKISRSRDCLIEFEDGAKVRTTVALLRKRKGK